MRHFLQAIGAAALVLGVAVVFGYSKDDARKYEAAHICWILLLGAAGSWALVWVAVNAYAWIIGYR